MPITLNGKTVQPLIESCIDFEFLKEEKDGKLNHYIHGIFLQQEIKNKNNRHYPKDVMWNEVNRYRRDMIDTHRAVGELGHPTSPSINPERVSHKILSLEQDGNNYIGKARISNSPYGKIVQNFLDEEIKFGVSSRGVGSIRRVNGSDQVQPDFLLATAADVVMDPSAPDAFVRGIMENKEYIFADGFILEAKIDKWKKSIKKATLNNLKESEIKAYREFMVSLDEAFKF